VALVAQVGGWGLLPALDAPSWLAIIIAVIALDLAIYLQHVLFHAVPVLCACTACITPTSRST
jgi:sterol desaturase/sphingolipid hydroxylase (fatty acid hydroxylase superfamily)